MNKINGKLPGWWTGNLEVTCSNAARCYVQLLLYNFIHRKVGNKIKNTK